MECRVAARGPRPVREVPLERVAPRTVTVRAGVRPAFAVALDPDEVAAKVREVQR